MFLYVIGLYAQNYAIRSKHLHDCGDLYDHLNEHKDLQFDNG